MHSGLPAILCHCPGCGAFIIRGRINQAQPRLSVGDSFLKDGREACKDLSIYSEDPDQPDTLEESELSASVDCQWLGPYRPPHRSVSQADLRLGDQPR